jgi:hypothetical protein
MQFRKTILLLTTLITLAGCVVAPPPSTAPMASDFRNNFRIAKINYLGDWDSTQGTKVTVATTGTVSQQKVAQFVTAALRENLSDQTGRVAIHLDISCRVVIPTGLANVFWGIGGTHTPNQMACFAAAKTASGKVVFGPGFVNFLHDHKKVATKLNRRDKILKNMSDKFASIVRNSLLGYGGPMMMDAR